MQQGTLDEAISWLGTAKQTRRHEPRQFPFMNLGYLYLKQGRWWAGLREFEGAVEKALRESYDYGAEVWAGLTEEKVLEMVPGRGGQPTQRWAAILGVIQDN